MAAKVGMNSATHESVTVPVGRDRKISTALKKQFRLQDSLPCPLRKKKER